MSIIIHKSTPLNEKIRELSNIWVKKHQIKGKHPNARLFIPVIREGKVVLICPDTGELKHVPKKIVQNAVNHLKRKPVS